MQLLELTRSNRLKIGQAFSAHKRVNLALDSILEGQHGTVSVDDVTSPTVYEISQPPFCFFAGDSTNPEAKRCIAALPSNSTILPSPEDWIDMAKSLHGDRLRSYKRFSFFSNDLSYTRIKELLAAADKKLEIRRIDLASAHRISLDRSQSFHLSNFDSPEDFVDRGVGFYCTDSNHIIGVSSSALVCSKGIEVNIMVHPEYRKKHIGTALAAKLIEYCLSNRIVPHWDAANPISVGLALKLGYERMIAYDAYWIKNVQ